MRRSWLVVTAGLVAVTPTACPGDDADVAVPEGWTEVRAGELAYTVPEDFAEPTEDTDPQAVVEHVRGDPQDLTRYEWIGVFRSPAVSTTGDEVTLVRYVDELFIVGGGLAGGYEDLEVRDREDLAIDGAVEDELLTVTYFEPRVDEEVVQTVVLVRTGEHIYDLRYISAASRHDDEVASMLPQTVRLP